MTFSPDQLLAINRTAYEAFAGPHTPFWIAANNLLSFTGTFEFLIAMSLVATVFIYRKTRSLKALWTMAVPSLGLLVNLGIKILIGLERPLSYEHGVQLAQFSYPSGHVTGAIVFYGTTYFMLVRSGVMTFHRLQVTALALFVAAIAMTRVFLGVHWLNDVVGASFFGSAWLFASLHMMEKHGIP